MEKKRFYSEAEIAIATILEENFPVGECSKSSIRKAVGKMYAQDVKELINSVGLEYENKQLAVSDLIILVDTFWGKGIAEKEEIKFLEIQDDMTIEEVRAMFFDDKALRLPPITLYRLDNRGRRYYYNVLPDGQPIFFQSVTTMIRNSLPTPPQLTQWVAQLGIEESKRYAKERADYGTFLHIQAASFLLNNEYDLDEMGQKLRLFLKQHEYNTYEYVNKWLDELKRDLLSFVQWAKDVNFRPIAIEITLCDPEKGIAGTLDIVGYLEELTEGFWGEVYKTDCKGGMKGDPKLSKKLVEYLAVIDIKSGRKGFYESHEIQLNAYKDLWDVNFPDKPIQRVYNWAPSEWRETPSYKFKDQTDSKKAKKMASLIEIARIEDENRTNEKTLTVIKGKVTRDSDLSKVVQVHPMSDVALEIIEQRIFEGKSAIVKEV